MIQTKERIKYAWGDGSLLKRNCRIKKHQALHNYGENYNSVTVTFSAKNNVLRWIGT